MYIIMPVAGVEKELDTRGIGEKVLAPYQFLVRWWLTKVL
jgi:hypothetical protein